MCALQSEPATEEQCYCSSTKKDININTTIFNININRNIKNMINISRNNMIKISRKVAQEEGWFKWSIG